MVQVVREVNAQDHREDIVSGAGTSLPGQRRCVQSHTVMIKTHSVDE